MSITFNWKKILFVSANVLMAVYLVLAITAFNVPADVRDKQVCTHITIDIQQDITNGFLTPDDVKAILQENNLYPTAKEMIVIDIRKIEETLITHPLIEEAECHKGQYGHIYISLKQRTPVLRVQSNSGEDYYVSNKGDIIAITGYYKDVVVATGNITTDFAANTLAPIAEKIITDKFWNNQLLQLNVLADQTMELVPRVGDNILYIGQPTDIENKLERLRLFYIHGLSQAGWNKYSRISVEFDNQIICKKRK